MSWMLTAIYDRFMRQSEEACLTAWRAELLEPVRGRVLEIGAGTGANLPHYGDGVTRLVLAEPDPHMRKRLGRVMAGHERHPVSLSRAPAEALDFPDGAFDAVVSTLVLCSVADPHRALAEVHRVLEPGGRLVFIEHVAAPDNPDRLRWQRRIQPVWKYIAGNCHCARDTAAAMREAGFDIRSLARASVRKALPWVRPSIRGFAVKPD
jgi:ubiquinone/menaquinone biosynthesis C-methylase UbiE